MSPLLLTRLYRQLPDPGDDRGATATEYAILVAFIAVVMMAGVLAFGNVVNAMFRAATGVF